jgi:hypothetical protein
MEIKYSQALHIFSKKNVLGQILNEKLMLFEFFDLLNSLFSLTQEGHDGPELTHLYIGHWGGANFNPGTFLFNKLGRHSLEDVS